VSGGCTRESKRCEYWTSGPDYMRPRCCTEHLKELLFFTEDALTRHGITHWLDYGSLLGAVRGGEFIPWDSDVDFGILQGDAELVHALESEIARAGHCLDTRDPFVWRVSYSPSNTQHVDIYPWWQENGLLKMRWRVCSNERWAFPRRFLDDAQPVRLYGKPFPAPAPVREFLAKYRYGPEFETPRRPEEDMAYRRSAGLDKIETSVRAFVAKRKQIQEFESNLALLHDVLESTSFAGRYWVIGGLLIGWAREGRVLAHDSYDADFGYLREDAPRFVEAAPRLEEAGFRAAYSLIDNRGAVVEYRVQKDGAHFDFFEHWRSGGALRYAVFGSEVRLGRRIRMEMIGEVAAHALAPMNFLGRIWQKPADHESYLTAIYGDWHVPKPDYDYNTDDLSVIEKTIWTGRFGSFGGATP